MLLRDLGDQAGAVGPALEQFFTLEAGERHHNPMGTLHGGILCDLADAAMGFVLMNKIQIITGSLDGTSGFLLSLLMCRAMNRSITNVLFGAFGQAQQLNQVGLGVEILEQQPHPLEILHGAHVFEEISTLALHGLLPGDLLFDAFAIDIYWKALKARVKEVRKATGNDKFCENFEIANKLAIAYREERPTKVVRA